MALKLRRNFGICLLATLLAAFLVLSGCSGRKKRRAARAKARLEATQKKGKGGPTLTQADDRALQKAIAEARRYLGTPHRDGGVSRAGMDCSGLMVVAFQAGGLSLPRRAAEQAQQGKPVALTEAEPGDLLFFCCTTGSKAITHVALVTQVREGVPWVIHTSSSQGVVEQPLSSPYWTQKFVGARRLR